MVALMLCWQRGSSLVRERLQEMSMPLEQFIDNIDNMVVARRPGMGVWLTKVAITARRPMLLHHVKHDGVMHKTLVLMTFITDRRPRVPFGERHAIERLGHGILSHPRPARFHADAGHSRSLKNCQMLGFAVDLEHVHYYIAHEIVARRAKNSAMAAVPFAIFAFLTRIASRAPDFFKIPPTDCPKWASASRFDSVPPMASRLAGGAAEMLHLPTIIPEDISQPWRRRPRRGTGWTPSRASPREAARKRSAAGAPLESAVLRRPRHAHRLGRHLVLSQDPDRPSGAGEAVCLGV